MEPLLPGGLAETVGAQGDLVAGRVVVLLAWGEVALEKPITAQQANQV